MRGCAQQNAEVQAIATAAGAPTFDNTVVALERSGALLSRVASPFFLRCRGGDERERIQAIQQQIAPMLSAHSDSIYLDAALFARVHAVYQQRKSAGAGRRGRNGCCRRRTITLCVRVRC